MNSEITNQCANPKMIWFPGIQEFRGLLIAVIVLSHAADFAFMRSKGVWGAAGVTGFFMIAGFLSPERIKATDVNVRCGIDNVLRTVKKIYFPYVVCLVAAVLVRPGSLVDFFKCIFLSQSYWGSISTATSFNGNTWFLSSILLSYFLAPFLSKIIIGKNLRNSVFLFLGLLVFQFLYGMFWSKWEFESGYYWFYIFPVYRIVDFAEGIVIRNIYDQHQKLFDSLEKPFFIASMLLFGVELMIIEGFTKPFQYDFAWVPVLSIILVCYASQRHIKLYPLGKLGEMSMEVFLSHRLVMLVVLRYGVFIILALSAAILLKMFRKKLKTKRQKMINNALI